MSKPIEYLVGTSTTQIDVPVIVASPTSSILDVEWETKYDYPFARLVEINKKWKIQIKTNDKNDEGKYTVELIATDKNSGLQVESKIKVKVTAKDLEKFHVPLPW